MIAKGEKGEKGKTREVREEGGDSDAGEGEKQNDDKEKIITEDGERDGSGYG